MHTTQRLLIAATSLFLLLLVAAHRDISAYYLVFQLLLAERSSFDFIKCIAAKPSSVSSGQHVKVAAAGRQRWLYFSSSPVCTGPVQEPSEWQSKAVVDCTLGSSCALASEFFPLDYLGLFVCLVALLPPEILFDAPRLLIIGGGGGVLANVLSRMLPLSTTIEVVEPDTAVLHLGTTHFGLPARPATGSVHCHQSFGRKYVKQHLRRRRPPFDLIILDAFENDGSESSTPRAWRSRSWCHELHAALDGRHGVLAANLYAADETTEPFRRRCSARFRQPQPRSVDGERIVLQAAPQQSVEAWRRKSPNAQQQQAALPGKVELVRAARGLQQRSRRPLPLSAVDLGALAGRAWSGS